MPPLKDELGPAAARSLARELVGAWALFPERRFTRGVAEALEPLELLARSDLLATRLVATMPPSFDEAAAVLSVALDSPTFTGWIVMPCASFVAKVGIEHPDAALPLLAALTPRWSSEFAIRPFIEQHPERTYGRLHEWVDHEDEHVRRLVSEGTRPRLPWAPQLRRLITDPSPNLPLLDALAADQSIYVRRSVANHLNDIAKDHPALALATAEQWAARGDDASWVIRHGLRSLVKRGDTQALRLVGAAVDTPVELLGLTLDRNEVVIGEEVEMEFTLVASSGRAPVDAVIDYRVHYVGARGTPKAPKVFKLTRRRLVAGQPITVTRRHSFEHVSIRRIHPGPHRIDVQVNGRVLGGVDVEVREERSGHPPAGDA